jgi:hypothetical protein
MEHEGPQMKRFYNVQYPHEFCRIFFRDFTRIMGSQYHYAEILNLPTAENPVIDARCIYTQQEMDDQDPEKILMCVFQDVWVGKYSEPNIEIRVSFHPGSVEIKTSEDRLELIKKVEEIIRETSDHDFKICAEDSAF